MITFSYMYIPLILILLSSLGMYLYYMGKIAGLQQRMTPVLKAWEEDSARIIAAWEDSTASVIAAWEKDSARWEQVLKKLL